MGGVEDASSIESSADVDDGARLGIGVRICHLAQVREDAEIGAETTIGRGVYTHPRAVNPGGSLMSAEDWAKVGVTVNDGAAIGARGVCVAPVEIGRWALVAAGAVVIRNVPDFGLVAGVPARRIGWVGPHGVPLEALGAGRFRCPVSGDVFLEADGVLSAV
jgi:UDP-2-acetamido-3-amino-2,3-dideoxy-glucuronate N-acetyltransferase